jgi:hypothetical protein
LGRSGCRFAGRLVLVLVSLVGSLLAAELVVRALDVAPEVYSVQRGRFRLSRNPLIQYELVPHFESDTTGGDGDERRLSKEEVMTIEVVAKRGMAGRAIARTLGVAESSVRYRLGPAASQAVDGRSRQPFGYSLATTTGLEAKRASGHLSRTSPSWRSLSGSATAKTSKVFPASIRPDRPK